MAFEATLRHSQPAGAPALPDTPLSLRAEHLLQVASAAMARCWPLLVAVIYLDCLGGILLGRGARDFTQIHWPFAALALTLLLAALDGRQDGPPSLHGRPPPRRASAEFALCAAALILLAGLLATACTAPPPHPTPLHWLVRALAGASCLVLALAAIGRLGRLAACLRKQDLSASPTGR